MNPQKLYARELRLILISAISFGAFSFFTGWPVAWFVVGWYLRSGMLILQMREAVIEDRVQALHEPPKQIGRN